jgi:hypothetical protein
MRRRGEPSRLIGAVRDSTEDGDPADECGRAGLPPGSGARNRRTSARRPQVLSNRWSLVGPGVPACSAPAMTRRDRTVERERNAVRYLLAEASGFLSAKRVAEAEELLRVAAPEPALEFMA